MNATSPTWRLDPCMHSWVSQSVITVFIEGIEATKWYQLYEHFHVSLLCFLLIADSGRNHEQFGRAIVCSPSGRHMKGKAINRDLWMMILKLATEVHPACSEEIRFKNSIGCLQDILLRETKLNNNSRMDAPQLDERSSSSGRPARWNFVQIRNPSQSVMLQSKTFSSISNHPLFTWGAHS